MSFVTGSEITAMDSRFRAQVVRNLINRLLAARVSHAMWR